MSFSNGNLEKLQLNNEELQKLLNKMSSDERQELASTLKSCTSEVTMTRGIPITAAVLGSLYYARTRLPAQYHIGPKGWPFYAIMGVGTLTCVNVMSMGKCRDRVQPLIAKLWKKYNVGQSSASYDEIRRRHRQESGYPTPDSMGVENQPPRRLENPMYTLPERPITDPYAMGTDTAPAPAFGSEMAGGIPKNEQTFDMTPESSSADQRRSRLSPPGYLYGSEAPSYMSGTPVSSQDTQFGYGYNR